MSTATRFWNWTADRYSRQSIADEAGYQKKIAITQKYLAPEMEVVEFGCGTGSTAIVHAGKVKTYHAIDVSERMIEIARGKVAAAGLSNFQFTVGTLEQAGLPGASCDAVLGLNILHLVPDLEATINTAARLLRPGGHLVTSTVCLKDLKGGLRWLALGARVIPFLPTVGSFSVGDLELVMESAGFAIEERFEQQSGVIFLVAVRC